MSPFNHGESGRKVKLGRDELTVDHNVRKLFLLLNSHANVSSSFIMLTSFHALILPPELAKLFFFLVFRFVSTRAVFSLFAQPKQKLGQARQIPKSSLSKENPRD